MAATKKKATTVTYTPKTWAQKLLSLLGDKATTANVDALLAEETAEGGNWMNTAAFNPINTTQREPGSTDFSPGKSVQAYTSWGSGLKATVTTLRNGRYGSILSALKSGKNAEAVDEAFDNSSWGTNDAVADLTSGSYKSYANKTGTGPAGSTAGIPAGTGAITLTPGTEASTGSSSPSLFSLAGFERLILEGVFVAGGVGLIGLGAYRAVTGQTPHPVKAAKSAATTAAEAGAVAA